MARKIKKPPAPKPFVVENNELEALAIVIHNESEAKQHVIWKRRGHHGGYDIRPWEVIADGFYKENVRKAAAKRLEIKVIRKKKK